MTSAILIVTILLALATSSMAFQLRSSNVVKSQALSRSQLRLSAGDFQSILASSLPVAETSVLEDDVLEVTGQMSNLPDPIYAIVFAAVVFAGVAVLQFSLGDITKEEGQARVRDFLQTKKDTERKRGYFD
jgi:hypothetical protein